MSGSSSFPSPLLAFHRCPFCLGKDGTEIMSFFGDSPLVTFTVLKDNTTIVSCDGDGRIHVLQFKNI